jgi:hypothetical protein
MPFDDTVPDRGERQPFTSETVFANLHGPRRYILSTSACRLLAVSVLQIGQNQNPLIAYDDAGPEINLQRMFARIPAEVRLHRLEWPCAHGLTVSVGDGAVVCVLIEEFVP